MHLLSYTESLGQLNAHQLNLRTISEYEGILSMFGDRIGKLLLKQAVEQNVCNHILASDTDIDAATYQKMRGMSYQEVLRTNGQISFPEVLRQQKRL